WRVKISFGRILQLPRTLTEGETRSLLMQARKNESMAEPKRNATQAGNHAQQASSRAYRTVRNSALVDLLFATGMRVGEVSALDVRDFIEQELTFRVHGKGGRGRLAFAVDDRTVRIQRKHLHARMQIVTDSSALFLNAH